MQRNSKEEKTVQNPGCFVCDNQNYNDENDNEISDDNEYWIKSCGNSRYNYVQNGNYEGGTWDYCGKESDGMMRTMMDSSM